LLERADRWLNLPVLSKSTVAMWTNAVRHNLEKVYGKGSPLLGTFPRVDGERFVVDPDRELRQRVSHLRRLVESLEIAPVTAVAERGRKIFIGHGRSQLWRELKDYIHDDLGLDYEEFNRESPAGFSTTERLKQMLSETSFAFLVMTAEEEHADKTVHARPNVVHEVGLFQGKLGFERSIVLLEEGCSEFSNIAGLTQIRFPLRDISARFHEVRRVLGRENIVGAESK